jgi:hypothetical protein
VIVAFLAGVGAVDVWSVDWPVEKRIITGTFGEDRDDHFSHGLEIGGAGQVVKPVLDGELVFRYDGQDDYTSVPRGTGALVVLRHPQDILSQYAHLALGSLGAVRTHYSAGDTIGMVGDTGKAAGALLSFSVYDEEASAYVNPLAFLPATVDTQPPLIRRVLLAVGDQRQEVQAATKVKGGRAAVLAEVYDLREDVRFHWPLAPYALRLALDGMDLSTITFDTLSVREGVMILGPAGLARGDLYAGDGLLRFGFVDLHAGASRLVIAVRDFAGNETLKEFALTVDNP